MARDGATSGTRGGDGVRWGRVALVVVVLAVINVPFGLHLWEVNRVATQGQRVVATVVEVHPAGSDESLTVRFPRSIDPQQKVHVATVTRAAGLAAQRNQTIGARVLKSNPEVFRLDGQVRSSAGLVITIVADLLVVVMLMLSWRLGGRLRRPTLIGVAVEDVRTGEVGSLLDKQDDGTYVINGEVASTGPSSLVLSLRDRDVEIHLRDHDNPVAVGERAQVRAQLVG